VAFQDSNPQAPVHFLVVPLEHIPSLAEVGDEHEEIVGHAVSVATTVARRQGIVERGFRLVVNCRRHGGQTIPHLHLHVLGGRQMTWPPG
jgi:histidine triad (HIT) family protein